jgi:exonuclease SbcD
MSGGVRFVHAADLHLDAPFAGVSADDARVGSALADATYAAFERVIDTCIGREAHFLVIAGDAYNSSHTSLTAQLRFRAGMERLAAVGIEAFIVHGNHDPASGYSARLEMPESVHVYSTDRVERFEVKRDGEVVAAVYGRSFAKSAELENFAVGYARGASDPVAIGVLHANVGGNPDYDPYAPASLENLRAAQMDYWALGHIHKQEVLSRDPWIVYSGSPQGLNPKETGPHGCLVVEITAGGAVSVEHVETAPVAWTQFDCDASATQSVDQLAVLLGAACDDLRQQAGRPAIARITLIGRTEVHADLARSGALSALVEEVRREQAAREPWLWLDRVRNHTSAAIDLEAVRAGADFATELVRIADELAADPTALAGMVDEIAGPLGTTLQGYLPGITPVEALQEARDSALDLLLAKGAER